MMTEELIKCSKCGYEKALTHWSSGGEVNWVACPKCRTFFDFGKEKVIDGEKEPEFWRNVEKDTGFKRCVICGEPYEGYGCNARPVKEGSCCESCDEKVVIPERIRRIEEWRMR